MLSDKPRMVFVDLWGKEITPAPYKQPDMTGIAMPDANGMLRVSRPVDQQMINNLEESPF